MNIQLVNRATRHIAYLRYTGPYGLGVSSFWQDVYVPWAIASKLGPNHARYGISHDDPNTTSPALCRYDACAEVSADYVPIGHAVKATVPGGKYAVLEFKGDAEEIVRAWSALLHEWLPASGLHLDERPCFEYYPVNASVDSASEEFTCQLCIPIASAD
jgi:AraC family transcriptional regulator